jgi:hypothetical protein
MFCVVGDAGGGAAAVRGGTERASTGWVTNEITVRRFLWRCG